MFGNNINSNTLASARAHPGAQEVHETALALDTLPTAHAAHLVLGSVSSSCLPAGQLVQAVELAAECLPGLGQVVIERFSQEGSLMRR